jgi:hypothetical protein
MYQRVDTTLASFVLATDAESKVVCGGSTVWSVILAVDRTADRERS